MSTLLHRNRGLFQLLSHYSNKKAVSGAYSAVFAADGARLIPINAIPAASGHVHNTTQPYAFCYSAGVLMHKCDLT